ncbi:hypothetical protein IWW38_005577 [Coemansia aciculifera]|uniref:Uncharacterized protein n=1 Tax=Coemansia aciculifera TaxID=417176 RepID=A0ACC1LVE4_9FUNG|nr:hypothetical protein IWW38_005577 [Coemansia aciculifera]
MQSQETVDLTGDSEDDDGTSQPPPRGGRGSVEAGVNSSSAAEPHLEKSKRKHRHLQKIKTFFHERGIAMGHHSRADDSSRFTTGQLAARATVLTKDGQTVSLAQEGMAVGSRVILCNPGTLLFNATMGDRGWGCGYRNCQMLISSLMRKARAPVLDGAASRMPTEAVPQIRQLQEMLELAWRDGYDGVGAEQLDHRAMGTRKWIGTTEIYCILAHLGVRSHIVDFHCPTAADGSHLAMFSWVVEYFTSSGESPTAGVSFADKHPLYLQHQGHSRTVVGVEISDDAICLLVFDPDVDIRPSTSSAAGGSVRLSRFRLPLTRTRRTKQFQILYVEDDCCSPVPVPKQIASQRIP